MSDSGTNEEALAAVLLQWEEAWEKGEDIPAETLCTECPEMIERVQDRVTALKQMSWMTKAANANEGRFTEPDLLLGKTLAGLSLRLVAASSILDHVIRFIIT